MLRPSTGHRERGAAGSNGPDCRDAGSGALLYLLRGACPCSHHPGSSRKSATVSASSCTAFTLRFPARSSVLLLIFAPRCCPWLLRRGALVSSCRRRYGGVRAFSGERHHDPFITSRVGLRPALCGCCRGRPHGCPRAIRSSVTAVTRLWLFRPEREPDWFSRGYTATTAPLDLYHALRRSGG